MRARSIMCWLLAGDLLPFYRKVRARSVSLWFWAAVWWYAASKFVGREVRARLDNASEVLFVNEVLVLWKLDRKNVRCK